MTGGNGSLEDAIDRDPKSDRVATALCKQIRTKPQRQASSYDGATYRYVALGG